MVNGKYTPEERSVKTDWHIARKKYLRAKTEKFKNKHFKNMNDLENKLNNLLHIKKIRRKYVKNE